VFCPENGDPAKVKPKLYIDRDRFNLATGQGFLLGVDDARVSITARLGFESEVARLDTLLNDPAAGVPLGENFEALAAAQRRRASDERG
jgi:putative selenate reductase